MHGIIHTKNTSTNNQAALLTSEIISQVSHPQGVFHTKWWWSNRCG